MIRFGRMAPHPDGESVISGGGGMMMMQSGGPGSGPSAPTSRPVEHISLAGEEAEASAMVEAWLPPPGEPQEMEGGGLQFRMAAALPRTFEPSLLVGVLPGGGIAYADSSTWTIKVTSASGDVSSVLRRPIYPVETTEAIQEEERARRLAELESGGGPQMRIMTQGPGGGSQAISNDAVREMMQNQVAQMQFYPELPVLFEMRSSWNGMLWVQRRGDAPSQGGVIDVVDPTGEYVGTFAAGTTALPSAFGPDGLAAFVETDDFDVPTVVVRRMSERIN